MSLGQAGSDDFEIELDVGQYGLRQAERESTVVRILERLEMFVKLIRDMRRVASLCCLGVQGYLHKDT